MLQMKNMEELYFIIADTVFEIVSITYSIKLSFQMSSTAKYMFHAFYQSPKIIVHFYHRKKELLSLSKFKKAKELIFHSKFSLNASYVNELNVLTNINTLRIDCPVNRNMCVNNLIKLTSLSFNSTEASMLNYHSKNIRKLTAMVKANLNHEFFETCCNLESLNVTLSKNDTFFENFTYTKLTNLTIKTIGVRYPYYFHTKYFENINNLCLFDWMLDCDNENFQGLTVLTLLEIGRYCKFDFMYNLQELYLLGKKSDIVILNLDKLKNLKILYFEGWDKNDKSSDVHVSISRRNNVSELLTKLERLIIKNVNNFYVHSCELDKFKLLTHMQLNDAIFDYMPDFYTHVLELHPRKDIKYRNIIWL